MEQNNNLNRPGVVNKFQIPNINPVNLVGTGVNNKFTQNLMKTASRPQLIQSPNAPVVFTSAGTYSFTVPGTQTQPLDFTIVGAGGGGGGRVSGAGGGGGASGVVISGTILWSAGQTLTVTIGTGGAGGAPNVSGRSGGASILSWDTIMITASGGFGGGGGISGSPGLGAAGGTNGGAVPTFSNVSSITNCNLSYYYSLGGYNANGNAGGSEVMYQSDSTDYFSGSPPVVNLINGTFYQSGGGSGSTGDGTGGAGGDGYALFFVNG